MADVIICLGDSLSKPETINMELKIEKAVELFKQGRAKKIIFTGGYTGGPDLSEAKFMADIAVKLGVPERDIILEEKATTTAGNAYYSQKIIDRHKFKSAIIVASPYHLRRAGYIFKKVMRNKEFELEKSKTNFGFFESIPCRLREIRCLIEFKIKGINSSKL